MFNTITLVFVTFLSSTSTINYILAYGLLSSLIIVLVLLIIVRNINENILSTINIVDSSNDSQSMKDDSIFLSQIGSEGIVNKK